jgi:hypothetical protein
MTMVASAIIKNANIRKDRDRVCEYCEWLAFYPLLEKKSKTHKQPVGKPGGKKR